MKKYRTFVPAKPQQRTYAELYREYQRFSGQLTVSVDVADCAGGAGLATPLDRTNTRLRTLANMTSTLRSWAQALQRFVHTGALSHVPKLLRSANWVSHREGILSKLKDTYHWDGDITTLMVQANGWDSLDRVTLYISGLRIPSAVWSAPSLCHVSLHDGRA